MPKFVWSDDLSVGNKMIDDDHQKLVKLIDDFHEAMERGQGIVVIGDVLNNLVLYANGHFEREEAEMRRIKFSGYAAHQQEHAKLLGQVKDLQHEFKLGKKMLTLELSQFLFNWLFFHILKVDHLLAAAIAEAA